jgi:hypothetical protein
VRDIFCFILDDEFVGMKITSMENHARKLYTEEEYLALERKAEFKSEYFAGEIFMMAGVARFEARQQAATGDHQPSDGRWGPRCSPCEQPWPCRAALEAENARLRALTTTMLRRRGLPHLVARAAPAALLLVSVGHQNGTSSKSTTSVVCCC